MAGHWHGKQYLDAHWQDHHWVRGTVVVPPVPVPSHRPGFSVRTSSIPIRRPRLVLQARAAEIRVEIPAARCVIGSAPLPLRLQAGGVSVGLQAGEARVLVTARPGPLTLRATAAPTLYVRVAPARGIVTEAGDEAIALTLLGLL